VRELENVIQKAVALTDADEIAPAHLELEESATAESVKADEIYRTLVKDKDYDIVAFRNKFGEKILSQVIKIGIGEKRDLKLAALHLGFIAGADDTKGYDNFRQWMRRLGIRKKDVI